MSDVRFGFNRKPTRVLIDMDNTITDFDGAVQTECQRRGVHYADDRTKFDFDTEVYDVFYDIALKPGFFRDLVPIPHALEALVEMKECGLDMWICTAPMFHSNYCVAEKFQWVEHYLGLDWMYRIIVSKDKTLIKGDYLIDDKIQTGACAPEWIQICYAQTYNQQYPKRIDNWKNWKKIFQ